LSEKHFIGSSIKLDSPIWNLLPAGNSLLAIENRDESKRTVSFSLFDFLENKFLWKDKVLSEKWWVTLAGVSSDRIYVKVFENTENPDRITLTSISIKGGIEVDEEIQDGNWNTIQQDQPFLYYEGEEDFTLIKEFIEKKLNITPKLGVEYFEGFDRLFVSFYESISQGFSNRLVIFDKQGKLLFEEEIGTNLKGIGINTFFLTSNHLFFVKNRSELVTFRIV
jgi:hypothetical protein